MRISMLVSQPPQPALATPPGKLKIDTLNLWRRPMEKVVVVMGATGTGKSRLSIDLATQFQAEVINSDKIQVYKGLDIVTNKITEEEQKRVPHHFLGTINPNAYFTASDFCNLAAVSMESISSQNKLPVIAGGSNSYIQALVEDYRIQSRYEFCFLWVDVAMPVLRRYVSERVDRMVENGMVDEAREFFSFNGDYKKGIRKAIGVPEFDDFFRSEPFLDPKTRERMLKKAIQEIKDNTYELACRQLGKIERLKSVKKWKIHRIDATGVFCGQGKGADEAWEEVVAGPGSEIVAQFLRRGTSKEEPTAQSLFLPLRNYTATQCLVA